MWGGRKDREETGDRPAAPMPRRSQPSIRPLGEASPGQSTAQPASPPAARSAPAGTRIGNTMCVEGEIIGREDVYLDGVVKGSIKLEQGCLTIGANGNVEADIDVRALVLLGSLKGKVHVVERIEIRKTGSFEGDIVAGNIVMEDGAIFRGSIDITRPKQTQAAASSPKPDQAVRQATPSPAPRNPAPRNPAPRNPTPRNPTPRNPTPRNPTPRNPTEQSPA